jgi:hypothetical protein
MSQWRVREPSREAEAVRAAVLGKLDAHFKDLEEASSGNVQFRKKNGKVEVTLTTTK